MIMENLQTVIVFIVGLFLGAYLPSYFKKKGENLATKEDIASIEKEIQEVRSQYSKDLELLRSELTKKSYIYGVRYENEFILLRELWPKLVDLRQAAITLRPEIDIADASDQNVKKNGLIDFTTQLKLFMILSKKISHFIHLKFMMSLKS